MPDEQLDDARPPLWKKLDKIERDLAVAAEKLKMIEDAFLRHLDFHDGMTKSLDGIRDRLEQIGLILADMKREIESEKKRVDGLWDFPRKILVYLGLGSSAAIGWYQIWKWFSHSTEIKIPK